MRPFTAWSTAMTDADLKAPDLYLHAVPYAMPLAVREILR